LSQRGSNYEATEENCILRNFIICAHHHILLVIKSRRTRRAGHVTHMRGWRGGDSYRVFWRSLNEIEHLGDLGVDGSVLVLILRTRWQDVDWIDLTPERDA